MKYIIILILLIIILLFLLNKKKQIEYKEKYTSLECDYNCGKYNTDDECLECENCGICSLTDNKGNTKKQCLPGTKNGSFFNQSCKGNAWTYYDDEKRKEIEENKKTKIVQLKKVGQEVNQEELSEYDKILLAMDKNLTKRYSDIKPKQIIKPIFKPSEPILQPVIQKSEKSQINTNSKNKISTYDEVLLELESLSSF
jgi:hypothetical protein